MRSQTAGPAPGATGVDARRISRRAAANSSEVIAEKSLRRRISWALCPRCSGSPSAARRVALQAHVPAHSLGVGRHRPRIGLARRRADRRREEPGAKRAIEGLELLAPGDERGAQRPVDVVLPRHVDPVEPAQGVGEATRADLHARLAQDAPEGHDLPREALAHVTTRRGGDAGRPDEVWATVSSRTVSKSSRYLSTDPSVCSTIAGSRSSQPRTASVLAQSIVSATPGGLLRSMLAQAGDERRCLSREPLGDARHAQADDLDLALERWVGDPVKQAAALERVVQLARAVRGQDDGRSARGRGSCRSPGS